MTLSTIALVVVLVLSVTSPVLAGPVTTSPFPSGLVASGMARCAVSNGGTTTTSTSTATLLDASGAVLHASGPFFLAPGETRFGTPSALLVSTPTICKCVVPNSKHKCAFQYIDGSNVTVIPAN